MNINDIEIFILTHNRAALLEITIKNILEQSALPDIITVLDNESTDNTCEVVSKYAARGVKYKKTFGFFGNPNEVHKSASKKYVCMFHNDDLLHPNYLETAVKILNKHEDLVMLTARFTDFRETPPEFKKTQKVSNKYILFENQKDFARYMFFCHGIPYAPAIYKTEIFRQIPHEPEKYGKFNDWPFMVNIAAKGKSAILTDRNHFLARLHPGQNTADQKDTLTLDQIINWDINLVNAMKPWETFPLTCAYALRMKENLIWKYDGCTSKEFKQKYDKEYVFAKAAQVLPFHLEKEVDFVPRFVKKIINKGVTKTLRKGSIRKYKTDNKNG